MEMIKFISDVAMSQLTFAYNYALFGAYLSDQGLVTNSDGASR